ncbi:MAG: tetratricopeptide repeat protein, partial [bacterium]|nr:tetratricopeptide repeat protein [bacterium]
MPIKVVKREEKRQEETVAQINNLGMSYLLKGMLSEAEAEFKRAIEKKPEYSKGHNNLGVVYLQQNRLDEAIKEFKLAIKYDPNNAEAHNNLGVAYCNKQKYTEAKDSFRKALAINPNYEKAKENLALLELNLRSVTSGVKSESKENIKDNNSQKTQKPNKLPTVSLCMIVKNEEEHLPKALSSVKDVVDEIIIVDTGSTDNTVEIAKSFGAKVYYYQWNDDFASARNEALKHATCDWILSMDADDEINAEQFKRLKEILSNLGEDVLGVQLPIYSKTFDGNTMMNYLIRLFRNKHEIRFSRKIHEVVDFSINKLGGRVIRATDVPVIHRGYEEPDAVRRKIERNFKLIKEEVERNPDDASMWMYMAKSYCSMGNLEEGISAYEKAIEVAGSNSIFKFAKLVSLIDLATLYMNKGELDLAELYALKAVNLDPNFPDAHYIAGNVYFKKKQFEDAYSEFRKVLDVDPMKSFGLVFTSQVRGLPLYIMLTACA